jgi:hypothetical protein
LEFLLILNKPSILSAELYYILTLVKKLVAKEGGKTGRVEPEMEGTSFLAKQSLLHLPKATGSERKITDFNMN